MPSRPRINLAHIYPRIHPQAGRTTIAQRRLQREMSTERTTHLERTAQDPRDNKRHDVVLERIEQVNERVRTFRLRLKDGPIKFSAGQWLDTFVPDIPSPGGFTITSPPSAARRPASPYLDLAVQCCPLNPPAAWLWRPQSEILASTLQVCVGGSFVFPPPSLREGERVKRAVFVAGGVGINPLMSMLSDIAEGGYGAVEVCVLYASKIAEGGVGDVLFVRRITDLFSRGRLKGRLQLFITGTRKDTAELERESGMQEMFESAGAELNTRRLSIADLKTAVGSTERESTVVYVCGPPDMTDELVEALTSDPEGIGLDKERVMVEKWW